MREIWGRINPEEGVRDILDGSGIEQDHGTITDDYSPLSSGDSTGI